MPAIESPCVNLCTLDERGVCSGCGRTLEEIAEWSSYTPEQRRAIMDELPSRLPQAAAP